MIDSSRTAVSDHPDCWPSLPLAAWKDTYATLHMWTQIVGKVRLALTPKINHWWNVPLYVSARGLTTSVIPDGSRVFDMEFDFVEHKLWIRTNDPATRTIALAPRSVADFYKEVMSVLRSLDINVEIWKMPVEVPDPIAFDRDTVHASYDPEYARRLWRILISTDEVFKVFRSRFIGKSSPAHFFWGAFDLAVTRFSGRRAPERNDPDPVLRKIMREAYSHEVISAGWWPGGGPVADAAFYAYAAPEPPGFAQQAVRPQKASYSKDVGEFLLMYDDVRKATSPTTVLLDFLESTYEAGATLGKWDREALEYQPQPATGAA
ncbi:MAG TPA: DUF5996 family protein [Candidatus Angelobacter sp.]|nr:DUF5996 family protein [Candidatus Angelobacter sp.]